MDHNLFRTMGMELRQLKRMHEDDWELQQIADLMLMQMRNYTAYGDKPVNAEAKKVIEKSYMNNLQWLVEWKRSKLAVTNPPL